MRVLVIILAVAAAPVAAAILWTRAQPDPVPATSLQPRGIVWADRVFTQPAELRRWLRARGERYKVWAKHHPVQAATLEHRQLPRTRTAAPEPRADSGSGSRKNYGDIFGLIFGFGALVVLTFQFGRRVRVARPRVRLPALAVDVAPLAEGVRRNLGRLGQAPEAIRAGRTRAREDRRELALPSPVRSRGNGSKPRPVEPRPVIRVSRAEEPQIVGEAVLEPELPPVEQATALAGPPLVEELTAIEEPQVEEPPRSDELPQIEAEPPKVEEPRGREPSKNGNHVAVRPELPPVEACASEGRLGSLCRVLLARLRQCALLCASGGGDGRDRDLAGVRVVGLAAGAEGQAGGPSRARRAPAAARGGGLGVARSRTRLVRAQVSARADRRVVAPFGV
jgi:hypothetical protein